MFYRNDLEFDEKVKFGNNVKVKMPGVSNIEKSRDIRNPKSGDMSSSGEIGLNNRTNARPKWNRTRCPEE